MNKLSWTKLMLVSLAGMADAVGHFLHLGGGSDRIRSHTPHVGGGGHRKQPRYKPYIPDGKYVMKFHRNTHRMKRRRHVCQPA